MRPLGATTLLKCIQEECGWRVTWNSVMYKADRRRNVVRQQRTTSQCGWWVSRDGTGQWYQHRRTWGGGERKENKEGAGTLVERFENEGAPRIPKEKQVTRWWKATLEGFQRLSARDLNWGMCITQIWRHFASFVSTNVRLSSDYDITVL